MTNHSPSPDGLGPALLKKGGGLKQIQNHNIQILNSMIWEMKDCNLKFWSLEFVCNLSPTRHSRFGDGTVLVIWNLFISGSAYCSPLTAHYSLFTFNF